MSREITSIKANSNLLKCTSFQLEQNKTWSIFFVIIFCAVNLISFLLTYIANGMSFNKSSNQISDVFIFACLFFLFFYLSSAFKRQFNHLLMMSNSRKNILHSFFITVLITAVLFSAVSAIIQLIVSLSSNLLNLSLIDALKLIYKNANYFSEFIWTSALFLMISSFALLFGSLKYKFGRIVAVIFWVAFGCSWTFLPIIIEFKLAPLFISLFTMFFSTDNQNGIYFSALNFTMASAVLCAATYLHSIRQEQKA